MDRLFFTFRNIQCFTGPRVCEALFIGANRANPRHPQRTEETVLTAKPETIRQFAVELARSCADDKCTDVVVLDLRGLSTVTDFFVIATGTSDRQIRAVVDHLRDLGKERDIKHAGVNGYEFSHWVLIDFVDVVAHVFSSQYRGIYDLELLWGDAPRVQWQRDADENIDTEKEA